MTHLLVRSESEHVGHVTVDGHTTAVRTAVTAITPRKRIASMGIVMGFTWQE